MPSQYRAIWTVPGGGTGYSVFHFASVVDSTSAQAAAARFRTFFFGLVSILPDDVQVNFDSEVVILDVNGGLVEVHPVNPPPVANGSSTQPYSRAAGARVDWGTGTIVGGRRLNGRTYIVPITSTAFDTEGVLTSTTITLLETVGQALIDNLATDGNPLQVWSRVHANANEVTSVSAPAAGAILRGRRD